MSQQPELLPFKKGSFYLAVQGQFMVYSSYKAGLTLVSWSTYHSDGLPKLSPLIRWQNPFSFWNSSPSQYVTSNDIFCYVSRLTQISVLPPIPTTGLTVSDVPDLVIKTRQVMLEALEELSLSLSPTPSEESDGALLPADPRLSTGGYQSISQIPTNPLQDEADVEDTLGGSKIVESNGENGDHVIEESSVDGMIDPEGKGAKKYAIA